MSIHIQMVESIPNPHRLAVLVQVNDDVSRDSSSWDDLGIVDTGYHDEVSIGKHDKVVMCSYDCDIATRAGCCRKGII
jgi:hypothetical protein